MTASGLNADKPMDMGGHQVRMYQATGATPGAKMSLTLAGVQPLPAEAPHSEANPGADGSRTASADGGETPAAEAAALPDNAGGAKTLAGLGLGALVLCGAFLIIRAPQRKKAKPAK